MHQQIRTVPAQSPADVAAFLKVLSDGKINIVAVGGGDVENGGEIAIAVEHGQEQAAMDLLGKHYTPRLIDVPNAELDNRPGALHAFVATIAAENKRKGWKIKDITVGAAEPNGKIPVQVYSEPA